MCYGHTIMNSKPLFFLDHSFCLCTEFFVVVVVMGYKICGWYTFNSENFDKNKKKKTSLPLLIVCKVHYGVAFPKLMHIGMQWKLWTYKNCSECFNVKFKVLIRCDILQLVFICERFKSLQFQYVSMCCLSY